MRRLMAGFGAAALLMLTATWPADAARNVPVAIQGVAYSPPTVTINPGDKVVWTHNDGSTPHSVTSDAASAESFDSSPTCPASGCMTQGAVFERTFNNLGSFPYHCKIHSSMHGTVVVQAATTTRAPTTTMRPVTTTRPAVTTSRATTSSVGPTTTETLALETTTTEESTTTTTGDVAINTDDGGGTNGWAVAGLVLAIMAVLGGGGYAIYRLRAGGA